MFNGKGYYLSSHEPDLLNAAEESIRLAGIVRDNANGYFAKKGGTSPLYERILVANYLKSFNSFQSVLVLCELGLVGDAKSICRKLVEMTICMKFLHDEWEDRQHLYWNSTLETLRKNTNKKIELAKELDLREWAEQLNKLKDDVEMSIREIRSSYESERVKKNIDVVSGWSKIQMGEKAELAGLKSLYTDAYLLFNRATHSGADDIPTYFDSTTGKFILDGEMEYLRGVMYEAMLAFARIGCLMGELFDLELRKSFEIHLQSVQECKPSQ